MPLASLVIGFWGEDQKGEQVHRAKDIKEEEGTPLEVVKEM